MKSLACALLLAMSVPAGAQDAGSALIGDFMRAWSAGDPKALSALFEPNADFVSPFGNAARGRSAIEAFYANVFASGYAGSRATGEVVTSRLLSPEVMLVDARFRIAGSHAPDGSARPEEGGVVFAVLHKNADGWRIAALRENEGAKDLAPAMQQ